METKEKIRALFYSDKEENRSLAFELAKGAGCYEEMVEEFYNALDEIPDFADKITYYLEEFKEEYETLPEGFELKKVCIERFTMDMFCANPNFNRRWTDEKKELKLKTIPKVLFNCDFITRLDFSYNDIETIPDDIAKLKNLKCLNLACNYQVKDLPDAMGKLTELEELDLYGIQGVFSKRLYENQDPKLDNYRYEMPSCVRTMKNLKSLNLGDVLLTEFPEWINELTNLETILIYSGWGSNPKLLLPSTFVELPKLKNLSIGSYTISIPNDIDKMQALEDIRIDPVIYIPETIKNLKKLKYLDFSYMSHKYSPINLEGCNQLWDLYDKGIPEGVSRIKIYGWEWLKEMTWLKQFTFVHIEPYAFTKLEIEELQEALPNCEIITKEG